jgi:hypothetical protein
MNAVTSIKPPAELSWRQYCRAIDRKPLDRAAAIDAWDGWLRAYVPIERERFAIPLPKLLRGEGAQ